MIRFAAVIGTVLFSLTALPVFAHNFLAAPAPGEVTIIPDITTSRAAYRELTKAGQVDVYEFRAAAGTAVYVQMTIPRLERLADFAPSFAIVSQDTDFAQLRDPKQLDLLERGNVMVDDPEAREHVAARSGEHVLSVDSDGSAPAAFHEPFTGTDYWERETIRFVAPASGTYLVEVFDHEGASGKYVLATGEKERFGFSDVLSFFHVRSTVRTYMEIGATGRPTAQ